MKQRYRQVLGINNQLLFQAPDHRMGLAEQESGITDVRSVILMLNTHFQTHKSPGGSNPPPAGEFGPET